MPHDHDISRGLIRTRQVDFHPKLKSWVPTPPTIRVETFEDTFKHEEEQRMAVSKCIAIAMMKQYLI